MRDKIGNHSPKLVRRHTNMQKEIKWKRLVTKREIEELEEGVLVRREPHRIRIGGAEDSGQAVLQLATKRRIAGRSKP